MKCTIINIVTGTALVLYQGTPALNAQRRMLTADAPISLPAPGLSLQFLPNIPSMGVPGFKREGAVRVGVVTPVTQMGQDVPGASLAQPLQALFLQQLAGPRVEAIPIAAIQPVQVYAESKSKDCDYVLYSTLSQKKAGSALAMLRTAAPMLSVVPMVGMAAGIGGMIAGQVAGAALSGGVSAAGTIKAKSELTLTYKLMRPGSTASVVENTFKTKAHADGEDVITPMLSQAVAQALGVLVKKN